MSTEINAELVQNIISIIQKGLISGLGKKEEGKFSINSAICFAMGEPHSTKPPTVNNTVRILSVLLNDCNWSGSLERGSGLVRLAIAQLGSLKINENEFKDSVLNTVIKKIVPRSIRSLKDSVADVNSKLDLEEYALKFEASIEVKEKSELLSSKTDTLLDQDKEISFLKSLNMGATYSALYANVALTSGSLENSITNSVYSVNASSGFGISDDNLSFFAEEVVQLLSSMNTEGSAFLDLTNI